MTIFDGVAMKPVLSPTMQGVLSVVTLVANSLLEADRVREERQTGEGEHPAGGTLEAVMAQAGLELPGLEQMLVQLMGGGEEARKAATLIVQNPDPAGLLQRFVEHFGRGDAANAGPTEATGSVSWTAPSSSTTTPSSGPRTFRPEFTRQGRAAARAAANKSTSTPPPEARPVSTSAAAPAAPTPSTASVAGPVSGRSSLVAMVEHQLGLLRHRAKAHEAELEERLTRAEAKLATLRKEFDELVVMRATTIGQAVEQSQVEAETSTGSGEQLAAENPAVVDTPAVSTTPACDAPAEAASDVAPPLPAASDEEAHQAVQLIAEFGDDIEAQHGRQLARVVAVEEEVEVMRTLVQREREALGVVESHG
jgi:hypothetical protein